MVNVGDFIELISFMNPTKVVNGSGGMSESYSPFLTVRASAKKLDGFRNFDSGYDGLVSVYEFICYGRNRLDNLINKDTRIKYYDKSYRVETWDTFTEGAYFIKIKASLIE